MGSDFEAEDFFKVADYLSSTKIEQTFFVRKNVKNINPRDFTKENLNLTILNYKKGFIDKEYLIKLMEISLKNKDFNSYFTILSADFKLFNSEIIEDKISEYLNFLSTRKGLLSGEDLNYILDKYKSKYPTVTLGLYSFNIVNYANPFLKEEWTEDFKKSTDKNVRKYSNIMINSNNKVVKREVFTDEGFTNNYVSNPKDFIDFDNLSYKLQTHYFDKVNEVFSSAKPTVNFNITDYYLLRYSNTLNEDILEKLISLNLYTLENKKLNSCFNAKLLDKLNLYGSDFFDEIIVNNPKLLGDNNSFESIIELIKKIDKKTNGYSVSYINEALLKLYDNFGENSFEKIKIIINFQNNDYNIYNISPELCIEYIKKSFNDYNLEDIFKSNLENENFIKLLSTNFDFKDEFVLKLYNESKNVFLLDIVKSILEENLDFEF